jgi:hypothetical protein
LNQGTVRFGWSFNEGQDVLSLRVGKTHFDIPGASVQAGANPVGNGTVAGAIAGAVGGDVTSNNATAAPSTATPAAASQSGSLK